MLLNLRSLSRESIHSDSNDLEILLESLILGRDFTSGSWAVSTGRS